MGDDLNSLTAFVRRGNPVPLARKSLVAIFDQALTRVERPLLAFDERYDVVIYPGRVHILNQKNFEALFKESGAVLARTSEWARNLASTLPMSISSMDWLATRLRQTSVMRRRVQNILHGSYLHELTREALCVKMKERGLDPQQLMDDDGLIINGYRAGCSAPTKRRPLDWRLLRGTVRCHPQVTAVTPHTAYYAY